MMLSRERSYSGVRRMSVSNRSNELPPLARWARTRAQTSAGLISRKPILDGTQVPRVATNCRAHSLGVNRVDVLVTNPVVKSEVLHHRSRSSLEFDPRGSTAKSRKCARCVRRAGVLVVAFLEDIGDPSNDISRPKESASGNRHPDQSREVPPSRPEVWWERCLLHVK